MYRCVYSFNFTHCVCVKIYPVMNIHVPAGVGAPQLDTQLQVSFPDHYFFFGKSFGMRTYLVILGCSIQLAETSEIFQVVR